MSDSLADGSFGTNGALEWSQWNIQWSQCNHHKQSLVPLKWHHLIHSMAILSSQSPFRVSGSFGDPMVPIDLMALLSTTVTMAIHLRQRHLLRQWGSIGINGNNGADGDHLEAMATMATMVPMATMDVPLGPLRSAIGFNGSKCSIHHST